MTCQVGPVIGSDTAPVRQPSKPLGIHRHGAVPGPLSRAGCSRQFGRASAPMMPQFVHTMRGPNDGTGMSLGQLSALSTA
jgi:hypothetical protein